MKLLMAVLAPTNVDGREIGRFWRRSIDRRLCCLGSTASFWIRGEAPLILAEALAAGRFWLHCALRWGQFSVLIPTLTFWRPL